MAGQLQENYIVTIATWQNRFNRYDRLKVRIFLISTSSAQVKPDQLLSVAHVLTALLLEMCSKLGKRQDFSTVHTKMRRFSPRHRIVLTLVVLSISPVLVAGAMGKIDMVGAARLVERQQACQEVSRTAVQHLEKNGAAVFNRRTTAIEKHPEISHYAIIRNDGVKLCDIRRKEPSGGEVL